MSSKFSVLMSIYEKENVGHFDRAMRSIWNDQTIKPNEIVLVKDGPLTQELDQAISAWSFELKDVLKIISIETNLGVGNAKNIGVKACSNELIAVMDTDDVSLPDRFEKQLTIFNSQDIDVCGAWVGEFIDNENSLVSYRRTPESHNAILVFAKSRSPVNHPTTMYKRSSVLKAGNYAKYRTSEDYNLFVKLIMSGAKLYNIQEPLVSMRIGNNQEARRRGLKNAIMEAGVQKEFYIMGFLNVYELCRNIAVGFFIRMLPRALLKVAFRMIRKL